MECPNCKNEMQPEFDRLAANQTDIECHCPICGYLFTLDTKGRCS